MISRRGVLLQLALVGGTSGFCADVRAQEADQWFPLRGDSGAAVPNARLPNELTAEVDELPGVIWLGSEAPDATLVEFFDYNCPYCRKAATDIPMLLRSSADLRLGFINNPILSEASKQAARVELVVLRAKGSAAAYDFHKRLFARRGVIDGEKALEAAQDIGLSRSTLEIEAAQSEITVALERQMRLAASLGFATTPSFLIAGAGIFGYPGPETLTRIITAVRTCDAIVC